MVGGVKAFYAVLLVLVMGVGCGGGKEEATPKAESPKETPKKLITNPIVEKAIRERLEKPTGELTKADLEKVELLGLGDKQLTSVKGLEKLTQLTHLNLGGNQLTDVKGLEKLTQLTFLRLDDNKLTAVKGLEKLTKLTELYLTCNPAFTKAQIDELQKALPKCLIYSDQSEDRGKEDRK